MKFIDSKRRRGLAKATWVQITSFAMLLTLSTGVSLGLPVQDNGCIAAEMQKIGCEHMGMEPNAADATGTALCCLLECRELGPTSAAFDLRLPVQKVISVDYAALIPPVTLRRLPQEQRLQSSSFTPPTSYLKNLALLI